MQKILWNSGDYTFFDFETYEFYWNASIEHHVQRLEYASPYIEAVTNDLVELAISNSSVCQRIRERASSLSVTQGTGVGRSERDWELHFAVLNGLNFSSTLEFREKEGTLQVRGRSINERSFRSANSHLLSSLFASTSEPT